jgi:hypothetical protein
MSKAKLAAKIVETIRPSHGGVLQRYTLQRLDTSTKTWKYQCTRTDDSGTDCKVQTATFAAMENHHRNHGMFECLVEDCYFNFSNFEDLVQHTIEMHEHQVSSCQLVTTTDILMLGNCSVSRKQIESPLLC